LNLLRHSLLIFYLEEEMWWCSDIVTCLVDQGIALGTWIQISPRQVVKFEFNKKYLE